VFHTRRNRPFRVPVLGTWLDQKSTSMSMIFLSIFLSGIAESVFNQLMCIIYGNFVLFNELRRYIARTPLNYFMVLFPDPPHGGSMTIKQFSSPQIEWHPVAKPKDFIAAMTARYTAAEYCVLPSTTTNLLIAQRLYLSMVSIIPAGSPEIPWPAGYGFFVQISRSTPSS
jgi:hypothetical protein